MREWLIFRRDILFPWWEELVRCQCQPAHRFVMGCSCLFLSPTFPKFLRNCLFQSELRMADSVGLASRPHSQGLSSARSLCRRLGFQDQEGLGKYVGSLVEAKVLLDAFLVVFISKLQKQFLWILPHLIREDFVLRDGVQGALGSFCAGPCHLPWAFRGLERPQTRCDLALVVLF